MISDVGNDIRGVNYIGLSDDTKPDDAHNGETFFEMDTSKVYMYSEDGDTWYEL